MIAAFATPFSPRRAKVAHHLAAAGRMADMDRVFQVEMFRHRGQVVGVMIHVVAVGQSGSTGHGRAGHAR